MYIVYQNCGKHNTETFSDTVDFANRLIELKTNGFDIVRFSSDPIPTKPAKSCPYNNYIDIPDF